MAAAPPDDPSPDEATDEGENRWGWYVVCNGRIVLAADKTVLSGWSTPDWPQWHSQYNGFMGIVFFSSRRPDILPLTTTKRSVDVSSEVFRRARPKMRDVSRSWISYTYQRKQDLEEAKKREAASAPISIHDIKSRPVAELPVIVRSKPKEQIDNVNYAVHRERLRQLAEALGHSRMSNRDVGLKSFDYAFDELVGDE